MKRMLPLLVGLLCTAAWLASLKAEETTRVAMRAKLDYARGALEGLTLAKFDRVTTNALQLRAHNYTNAFYSLGNIEYANRYTNFVRSVDRLLEAAKAEDLDRATAAYSLMTRDCIACHRTFRRDQRVKEQAEALKTAK